MMGQPNSISRSGIRNAHSNLQSALLCPNLAEALSAAKTRNGKHKDGDWGRLLGGRRPPVSPRRGRRARTWVQTWLRLAIKSVRPRATEAGLVQCPVCKTDNTQLQQFLRKERHKFISCQVRFGKGRVRSREVYPRRWPVPTVPIGPIVRRHPPGNRQGPHRQKVEAAGASESNSSSILPRSVRSDLHAASAARLR